MVHKKKKSFCTKKTRKAFITQDAPQLSALDLLVRGWGGGVGEMAELPFVLDNLKRWKTHPAACITVEVGGWGAGGDRGLDVDESGSQTG